MVFFNKKNKKEEYDEENYIPFACDPEEEKIWENTLIQNINNSNNSIAIVDEIGCIIHQNSKLNELCQTKKAKEIFDIIDEHSTEKLRVFFTKEKYRSRGTKFYVWIKENTEQNFEEKNENEKDLKKYFYLFCLFSTLVNCFRDERGTRYGKNNTHRSINKLK